MAKADKELGEMFQKIKAIEKILMGNGTKGLMKKMEECSDAIIRMEQANKTEDKFDMKFDKWSRTKLIIVFGIIQVILIVVISFILNKLGGG